MGYFSKKEKIEGSYYSSNLPYKNQKVGAFRVHAQQQNGGGSSGYNIDRFNPVYDRLEEGSVVEDWIPKDASGLNKLFRNIYLRDAIAGSTIDLYKNMPFSSFKLIGVEDDTPRKVYEDMMHALGMPENFSEWAGEYLVVGKVINSMLWNDDLGYFDDYISHDPDFVRITPIPYRGYAPLIDLVVSPAIRQFMQSTDERLNSVKRSLSDKTVFQAMQSGGIIPLEPLNTLYVARKATPYDYLGTSIYTRIIPFWAIEKALLNAMVTSARRRSRSILHVQAGIENLWEPQSNEIENIASMFIQADEDPVGAVVVTRRGVDAMEVRSGQDFWKLSDEWQFLSEGKMRSLGINDAFLSGESNFNTMEVSLSVFIENLRTFRDDFTRRIFNNNLFVTVARANRFLKPKKSDLAHGIRTRTYKNDEDIPIEELAIPQIVFDKQLRPEADDHYLGILATMEEKGVPVSIQTWAAAGGIDLEKQIDMLDSDLGYRKQMADYQTKKSELSGGGEGGPAFAYTGKPTPTSIYNLPLWKNSKFLALSAGELSDIIAKLKENKKVLKNSNETMHLISGSVKGSSFKTELAVYLLMRSSIKQKYEISASTRKEIADWILNSTLSPKKRIQELFFLQSLTAGKKDKEGFDDICKVSNTPQIPIKDTNGKEHHIISFKEEMEHIPENSSNVVNGLVEQV